MTVRLVCEKKRKSDGKTGDQGERGAQLRGAATMPTGALARAIKAGFMTRAEARQMSPDE